MSVNKEKRFDIHGSVHRRWLSRNTNKMQLCNRIYYFKVYWRLNMFRAAHRSSSGALNCLYSLWFIYPCGDRPLPRLSLGNGRSPHGYINQRLQIQLKLLMMSGVSLETCWAFNKLWNSKFCYKLYLVGISTESYYDARIHECQMSQSNVTIRLALSLVLFVWILILLVFLPLLVLLIKRTFCVEILVCCKLLFAARLCCFFPY